ncbi:MAG: hypothetical protein AB7V19_01810 [Candidatus Bipolaricaulia bacterium]
MSDDGKKKPFAVSFLNLAFSLFIGIILLTLAWELAKQIWWLLLLIGLAAIAAAVARWVHVQRKRWDD